MLRGWEGNRKSGVALAMRHRLCGLLHLRAQRPTTRTHAWSCGLLHLCLPITQKTVKVAIIGLIIAQML